VYPVIAKPPLSAGAVKVTETELGVTIEAVPIVGAPGTVCGSGQLDPIT
jgi:hypothetical protein